MFIITNTLEEYTVGSNIQGLFDLVVIQACHKLDEHGKLSISIKTNKDHYLRDIYRDLPNLKNIIDSDSIGKGDKISIYYNQNSNGNCLVWHVYNKNTTVQRIHPNNITTLTCPVCGEPLYLTNKNYYCRNSDCMAKLIYTIRRFLQIATYEQWDMEELAIFNKLVTLGRVKSLSDIYTLSIEELLSITDTNSREREVSVRVYTKINQSRGTIPLYKYLLSIISPYTKEVVLIEDTLEKSFEDISDFVKALGENDNPKINKCMNKYTRELLEEYFSIDSNISCLIKLIEENVFDS